MGEKGPLHSMSGVACAKGRLLSIPKVSITGRGSCSWIQVSCGSCRKQAVGREGAVVPPDMVCWQTRSRSEGCGAKERLLGAEGVTVSPGRSLGREACSFPTCAPAYVVRLPPVAASPVAFKWLCCEGRFL